MPYLKLLPYIAIAGLLAVVLWYRGEMIDAKAHKAAADAALSIAKESNEQQAKAIDKLVERKARDDQILADISAKLAGINQSVAETTETITKLEKNDETVRKYLDGVVPESLRRVLNKP
ncbi:hypothetical protein [Phyllobacterium sp. YR620]|uniref:hypothetical protein n=1 Tax=Phyllobacterium sp. YR620 TaxID=1881066 RepID=UPI000B882465|nr:hypothetical protein [Phyllobacterium sp. YR620]